MCSFYKNFKIKLQTFALALVCLSLNTSVNAGDSIPKFKVIAFYSATWDQAHISYAHECNRWFPQMAELYNFEYDSTNDWTNLNAEYLSQYQVVLFLDNSPSTAQQKAGFEEYMRNGGSWMGFHVCAFNQDPLAWDWYYNQFLGMGSYKSNTWAPSTAVLQVEDTTHPATINLPDTFTAAVNEWYAWMVDLRTKSNIKILCSVHPVSFPLGDGSGNGGASEIWTSGYYPAVWSNTDYNMMYVNMGHNKVNYSTNKDLSLTFSNETENKLILDGLFWLAELNMPDPRDTRLKITSPVNGTKLLDPATFTINVNATDSDGIAKIQFYNGNTLLGADSIAPYSFSWENVGIGYYNIKVKATDSLGNVASSSVGISVEGEGAYNNEIAPIPGKIEVENFDYGGQGVGYNDSEPSNQGAQYREADGVDIEECSDSGAGYNIGYVAANEWVKYTVDVNTAGIYTLQARVATQNANKKFHVELDDEDISGLITVPNTGGWQVWKTVNVVTAHLTTGQKKMKIIMDTDGFNLNYVNFTQDPIASVEINNSNYNLVYPNPSNGIVKIKLTQVESQNAVFTVIDNLGRELKSLQHKSNDEITLNCSNFNKGIYFIKSSDNSIPVQRIIIQ